MEKKSFLQYAVALLCALALPFSLASCGDDDDKGGGNGGLKLEAQAFTVGGVTFWMMPVEGGTFRMGSGEADGDAYDDEKPMHEVTVSSFYIGSTEVTQKLWQAVMGSNPSYFTGVDLPMEKVNWDDCQSFIAKLNELTGKKFRLPTEAEWEYAARGGSKGEGYYVFSGSNVIASVAWYDDNSDSKTHAVGTKQANGLGLFDMSGNVWEWCSDWYGSDYYAASPKTDPQGPATGTNRVVRGGSYYSLMNRCRVSHRGYDGPDNRDDNTGLRLVLAP